MLFPPNCVTLSTYLKHICFCECRFGFVFVNLECMFLEAGKLDLIMILHGYTNSCTPRQEAVIKKQRKV